MRTTTLPSQTVTENIQSVEYQVDAYVQVVIGVGSEVDGRFKYTVPQQFDVVRIMDRPAIVDPQTQEILQPALTDFSDLMAEYPGGSFTTDDLWPYIDKIRARR